MKRKKILLFLLMFACMNGVVFAQTTDDDQADAFVEILQAISIVNVDNMEFGRLVRTGATGGTSKIDSAAGTVSVTGDLVTLAGTTTTAASFTVSGDAAATFSISPITPTPINLSFVGAGGNDPIPMTDFTIHNASASTGAAFSTPISLASGPVTLKFGATITIGDATANPNGEYTGTFTVTVDYD